MNWYIEVLKKYAVFSGRARRKEFWFFVLFSTIVSIVLVVMDVMIGTLNQETGTGVLGSIYSLGVAIPYLAVTVRRLHDTNRSGWWVLMPIGAILLAGILAAVLIPTLANTAGDGNMLGVMIAALVGLIAIGTYITLLVFLASDGTRGTNRYGEDPKSRDVGQAYAQPIQNHHQGTVINTPMPNKQSVTLLGIGAHVPSVILSEGKEVILGRSSSANVQINNKYVSNKHLLLKLDSNGRVKVRDMASSNGTYIDGRKLDANTFYELKEGERLLLGSEDIVYSV